MTAIAPDLVVHTAGHVGLNVIDLDRSKDFYRHVFGLELAGEGAEGSRRWAFLTGGGRLVLTLWQQATDPFSPAASGLHHLSFEVESIERVRIAEDRLRAIGADFVYDGVVPHGESVDSGGIFFTDPDGTRLEIFAATGAGEADAPNGSAPTCGFF